MVYSPRLIGGRNDACLGFKSAVGDPVDFDSDAAEVRPTERFRGGFKELQSGRLLIAEPLKNGSPVICALRFESATNSIQFFVDFIGHESSS
jgi:hypothetical protein